MSDIQSWLTMWGRISSILKNQSLSPNLASICMYINNISVNILNQYYFNLMLSFCSYRPELYRCCLCWRDDVTLLIGWADMVQVGPMALTILGLHVTS